MSSLSAPERRGKRHSAQRSPREVSRYSRLSRVPWQGTTRCRRTPDDNWQTRFRPTAVPVPYSSYHGIVVVLLSYSWHWRQTRSSHAASRAASRTCSRTNRLRKGERLQSQRSILDSRSILSLPSSTPSQLVGSSSGRVRLANGPLFHCCVALPASSQDRTPHARPRRPAGFLVCAFIPN